MAGHRDLLLRKRLSPLSHAARRPLRARRGSPFGAGGLCPISATYPNPGDADGCRKSLSQSPSANMPGPHPCAERRTGHFWQGPLRLACDGRSAFWRRHPLCVLKPGEGAARTTGGHGQWSSIHAQILIPEQGRHYRYRSIIVTAFPDIAGTGSEASAKRLKSRAGNSQAETIGLPWGMDSFFAAAEFAKPDANSDQEARTEETKAR